MCGCAPPALSHNLGFAYNLLMLMDWFSLIAPAAQDRMILLLNHVISRESHAMARLQPFAKSTVLLHLSGWPTLLPAAPDLGLLITPAGLFERAEVAGSAAGVGPAALRIDLDAANPALLALGALSGARPRVTVQGDAGLAAEINWLMENLRWDLEEDLAGLVGPAAAHLLADWGRSAASAMARLAGLAGAAVAQRPTGGGFA